MNFKLVVLLVAGFVLSLRADLTDLSILSFELNKLATLDIQTTKKINNKLSGWDDALDLARSIDAEQKDLHFLKNPMFSDDPGYLLIYSENFKGKRDSKISINKIIGINKSDNDKKETKEKLVNQYKIHLMPKSMNDLSLILKKFLAEIKIDSRLQTSLNAMKFKCKIDFTNIDSLKKSLTLGKSEIMPVIVIYCAQDKELAEYLLNKLIALFHSIKGANLTPRYNKKITSLIYYAQGNGDDKMQEDLKEYYDKDLIFYAKDFEGVGKNIDYELKIGSKNLKYIKN